MSREGSYTVQPRRPPANPPRNLSVIPESLPDAVQRLLTDQDSSRLYVHTLILIGSSF